MIGSPIIYSVFHLLTRKERVGIGSDPYPIPTKKTNNETDSDLRRRP